jgi:hypothetical protein
MSTKYEKLIINPILKVIEKNQDYLCKLENLPQLSKLGYMFDNLWYAGRVCYGYHGLIKKGNSCENNPKYEIGDNIKYNSVENENLIYDAWVMHVTNEGHDNDYETFKKFILEGRKLSDFEIQLRKPNKTFDEWVNVLTNKEYKYSGIYSDRQSVANHLLCTIGNGYGYNQKTGMVIMKASGADQDQDLYGQWENAVFEPSILKVVNQILDVPECKISLDAYSNIIINSREERKKKEREDRFKFFGNLLPSINKRRIELGKTPLSIDDDNLYNYIEDSLNIKNTIQPKFEYYPICDYSIIMKLDKNSHTSYIKAALEICESIVADPPEIKKDFNQYQIDERNKVIIFCENFIKKFKKI